MAVTDADAQAAGRSRQSLAARNADAIRRSVDTYRDGHTWRHLLRAVAFSAIATFILGVLFWLIVKTPRYVTRKTFALAGSAAAGTKLRAFVDYFQAPVLLVGTVIRAIMILALLEAYITFVFDLFPATEHVSHSMTNWLFYELGLLASAAVDYVPDLLIVIIIAVVTYYIVRVNRLIFEEIAKGRIAIPGIYPDWTEPTSKLIRVLILALTQEYGGKHERIVRQVCREPSREPA